MKRFHDSLAFETTVVVSSAGLGSGSGSGSGLLESHSSAVHQRHVDQSS